MKPSVALSLICFAACSAVPSLAAAEKSVPQPPPKEVLTFDSGYVGHLFTTAGGPLHANTLYKVMAGRRVAPGSVEVHVLDTDVFYIVDGSATFVTGGTAVDLKQTKPNEFLGKSITGGTERHLAKGDVIIIPHGVPHQFTKVDGVFQYFVVKVTEPATP